MLCPTIDGRVGTAVDETIDRPPDRVGMPFDRAERIVERDRLADVAARRGVAHERLPDRAIAEVAVDEQQRMTTRRRAHRRPRRGTRLEERRREPHAAHRRVDLRVVRRAAARRQFKRCSAGTGSPASRDSTKLHAIASGCSAATDEDADERRGPRTDARHRTVESMPRRPLAATTSAAGPEAAQQTRDHDRVSTTSRVPSERSWRNCRSRSKSA